MSRKLNQFVLDPPQTCFHCDMPFEKPYHRIPEAEVHGESIVLLCPHCGCMTPLLLEVQSR